MLTLKALTLLLNQLSKTLQAECLLGPVLKMNSVKRAHYGWVCISAGSEISAAHWRVRNASVRLSGEHTICYICKCCFVRTVESVLICLYKQLISKQEKVLCRHPKCYGKKSLFKLTRKSKHVLYAKVYYFVLYFLFYFYELEWVLDQLYLLA